MFILHSRWHLTKVKAHRIMAFTTLADLVPACAFVGELVNARRGQMA